MHDPHDLTRPQLKNHTSPAASVDEPRSALPPNAQFEQLLADVQKLATVGQLTSGVAHAFNNLLQGIVGSVELARKLTALGRAAETEKFLTAALGSARRAAALTEQLLHFARPTKALHPQPVKVNSLITAVLDLLRGTQSSSIRIEVALAADSCTAVCDPERLEEAIVNVVVAACEAMPDGGNIVIETSNADIREPHRAISEVIPPGQYVCISIKHSGAGMRLEQMQSAFNPFSETHALSSASALALWMVHRFGREAGGYTDIESEVGRGSTVRMYVLAHLSST